MCRPSTSGPPPGFWDPNPWNSPQVAYSIRFPATRHVSPPPSTDWPAKSSWASLDSRPPSWFGQHGHSHVHLHSSMSQMSATTAGHPASWSVSPSLTSALHRSRSVSTTRLYLTFSSLSTTVSELHIWTPQAKRHVGHIAFAIVMLVANSNYSWITLTITHHKTNHKGTSRPCVRSLPLD